MKVAILGGGLTGLMLGHRLQEVDVKFDILERSPSCGGLLGSLEEDGFTFDKCGIHIIFSTDKSILSFMQRLLGENACKTRRNTKIYFKNRFMKYPFENGLHDLSKEDIFTCLHGFVYSILEERSGGKKPGDNLHDWLVKTFGSGISNLYLEPYNRKIWKRDPRTLNTGWISRIPRPPVADVIKSALGIHTEGYAPHQVFWYPKKGGIQSIPNAIAAPLHEHISTGFDVQGISREGSRWIVTNQSGESHEYDAIYSTIPVKSLISAMEDAPEAVMNASKHLQHNSLVTVNLGIDECLLDDLTWLYLPQKEYIAHKVGFPSNLSPSVAPANANAITAEITCKPGSSAWMMDDRHLIQQVKTDLKDIGIIGDARTLYARVHRREHAYVVPLLGTRSKLKTIEAYLDQVGIVPVGRFGEHQYLNMDGCIKHALEAPLPRA
ncbi:NAD(P)-binding protein [Candidatus Bathyarchaeota archaeon]|nr:NAD(P)-binding protein [Candidatus Bathyarchaeota archaeon]